MKMAIVKILIILSIMIAVICPAQAHPHMFFSSTAQFIIDSQGRLSKLRIVFLVDELNTMYTFAELGVNKDGDQTLTDKEADKITKTVLEGFGYYDYFTHLQSKDAVIALGKPLGVTAQLYQFRLGLEFILPLETPLLLSGKSVSLKLYDPTYFTAITIDLPPTIVGSDMNCAVSVTKPAETEQTRSNQIVLSQLSREETPEMENVGVLFAETTRLTCQDNPSERNYPMDGSDHDRDRRQRE